MEFTRLLYESVIVQSLVTLILVVAVIYCIIVQRAVPAEVWSLLSLVVGYWFGSKSNQQTTAALREALRNLHEVTRRQA